MAIQKNYRSLLKGLTASSAITLFALSTAITGCERAADDAGDAMEDAGEAVDDAIDDTGDAIDDTIDDTGGTYNEPAGTDPTGG